MILAQLGVAWEAFWGDFDPSWLQIEPNWPQIGPNYLQVDFKTPKTH